MPGSYNAGQSPVRVVMVDPSDLTDYKGQLNQPSSAGTDRSGTVGTTSAALIPANANRRKFIVKNDTATDVWLSLGGTATTTAGGGNIKVSANGGYFELDGYSGAVNAIVGTGSAAVTAREF